MYPLIPYHLERARGQGHPFLYQTVLTLKKLKASSILQKYPLEGPWFLNSHNDACRSPILQERGCCTSLLRALPLKVASDPQIPALLGHEESTPYSSKQDSLPLQYKRHSLSGSSYFQWTGMRRICSNFSPC